ncbi:MAG TPA: hypothetical protein VG777_04585 [Thermoanaerobaculia bacterium]|nr:hypothetical protein [Thermoanaerobaculia bacterium]
MSETAEPTESVAEVTPGATEDERRRAAAEVNRKRTEEEWLRNKQRWVKENFPEKKAPAAG